MERQTSDGMSYRVEIDYEPFADDVFEGAEDAGLYDRKMACVEETVLSLGEDPADEFFDAYQQARQETDAELPDFQANTQYGNQDRGRRAALLAFSAEEPVDTEAFDDAVEQALTETFADTVAGWYQARPATGYDEADLSVRIGRGQDAHGDTRFTIETDPDRSGDVMQQAADGPAPIA